MGLVSSRVVFLFVVSIFVIWAQVVDLAEGGAVRNYISWEDLQVNEQRLAVKSSHNQVRVITVNQNGGGHSKTVQGAVNMVPDNNRQRVKIFIFPGIYRSVLNCIFFHTTFWVLFSIIIGVSFQ